MAGMAEGGLIMNDLLLFAKYPEPGKVKTRLAAALGAEKAALFYKEMVEEVVKKTRPANGEYRPILCYDPPDRRDDFAKWLDLPLLKPQEGADLGEKMKNALAESLREAGKVLVIGTDCVDIDRPLVIEAFGKLDDADIVLGPVKDGGYYLIGCKKIYPEVFTAIDWSTERVLTQTLERARALKLRVSLLPELEDIDTVEQYLRP